MNNKGFSLVEVIAVMIIMSVLAVAFVPKLVKVDKTAEIQGLDMGINEINNREKLTWSNKKISHDSYSDEELDELIKAEVDRNISYRYSWNGDILTFAGVSVSLERIPATNKKPAFYKEVK
jgi:prepilin-type N-terminal cleavage/methylation domain-containing protein